MYYAMLRKYILGKKNRLFIALQNFFSSTVEDPCAALGGICYSWIMLSGYTLHGLGMEMDAIASSVIGGTQLMGGVGFMPGTLLGVMIQGSILTIISFQGTLSAWWTKIVVGLLLCLFIVMQALVNAHKNKLMNQIAEGSVKDSK